MSSENSRQSVSSGSSGMEETLQTGAKMVVMPRGADQAVLIFKPGFGCSEAACDLLTVDDLEIVIDLLRNALSTMRRDRQ